MCQLDMSTFFICDYSGNALRVVISGNNVIISKFDIQTLTFKLSQIYANVADILFYENKTHFYDFPEHTYFTFLIRINKNTYLYIGKTQYSFEIDDNISAFNSYMTDNIEHSYAIGEKYTYILDSHKYTTNKNVSIILDKKDISASEKSQTNDIVECKFRDLQLRQIVL